MSKRLSVSEWRELERQGYTSLINDEPHALEFVEGVGTCLGPVTVESDADIAGTPIDVCGNCGQSMLTSPDDPRPSLLCDVCLGAM